MYAFQLIWNSFDIQLLQSFTEKEWEIFERGNTYYIKTPHTNNEAIDTDWLRAQISNHISIWNGIARLKYSDHENVQVGCFCELLPDGTILANMKGNIEVRLRMRATLSFAWEIQPQISDIKKYRITAEKNTSVRDVLHYFENPDWWNLYKIYESIRSDAKWNDAFSGYTKKISNFSWTANNYNNIWDKARHSLKWSDQAMTNPITLMESQELWRSIIIKWIELKSSGTSY